MNTSLPSSPFSAPLCEECAPYAEMILSCDWEPSCDECWEKIPDSVHRVWENRADREREWYGRWLHGEG